MEKEGRVWTVSGVGGEGVDWEWGRRGGCGLLVGKEGRGDICHQHCTKIPFT